MLKKEKPDIVDICLPTKFHESIFVEVMKQGYNVLCEKLMADTYAQCLNMIEVSKETGKNLMICQCVRFYLSMNICSRQWSTADMASFYLHLMMARKHK